MLVSIFKTRKMQDALNITPDQKHAFRKKNDLLSETIRGKIFSAETNNLAVFLFVNSQANDIFTVCGYATLTHRHCRLINAFVTLIVGRNFGALSVIHIFSMIL